MGPLVFVFALLQRRATVLTTDGKWKLVKLSLKLKLIRNAH